ncbi:MAG: hypothetical protein QM582_14870, partial [Micropruina sp.]|uniref:hypothetical protein n=1 Tax=Micropruina sp. TaxID=2737536 RepID=UPI0039E6E156
MTQAPAAPAEEAPALLASLRPAVLALLAIECANGLLSWPEGLARSGWYGLITIVQFAVITAGIAALLWRRAAATIVCGAAAGVLAVAFGGSGYEPWLIIVAGILAGAHESGLWLRLTVAILVGYSVVFSLRAESFEAGWGLLVFATLIGLTAVCLGIGLIARRFLRTAQRRRERERSVRDASARQRADVRNRIADDVEAVVTAGLDRITAQAEAASDGTISRESLRRELELIEGQCRSSLDQLRTLLGALRSADAPAAEPARPASGRRRS